MLCWHAGALPCGVDAIESLRVLEGTPAYSIDITAKDLPQETNQMRALHFNKGCYLGQEIVERIHSRGNVHRTFTGFLLADSSPTPGTPLLAEGKPVGETHQCRSRRSSRRSRRTCVGTGQYSPRSVGAQKRSAGRRNCGAPLAASLRLQQRIRSALRNDVPGFTHFVPGNESRYARKRTAGHVHRSSQDFF